MGTSKKESGTLSEARRRLHTAKGALAYHLESFGDFIAKREKYKALDGMEALFFYLIQKYHWLPSQVRSLNIDDLQLLFEEEMSRAEWRPS